MLLTITTTYKPATDLGYLLHKNPARCQDFKLPFGKAYVFFPEATEKKCTAALLLDVDPIGIVRGKKSYRFSHLSQYVNDRPYAVSSFMSGAISKIFGTGLNGKCNQKPELVDTPIPLTAKLSVLPCRRGGENLLESLFTPLGYEIKAKREPLDTKFKEWGESPYYTVEISQTITLKEMLNHLYVLIPVLDNSKHYFIGDDEIDKLLDKGKGWLASHPEKDIITRRYLKYRTSMAREALSRLLDEMPDEELPEEKVKETVEESLEKGISLNEARLGSVLSALKGSGASSVLDLGCGEGKLLRLLLKDKQFKRILGMDLSIRSLEIAHDRLHLDKISPRVRERIELIHGSLLYRDKRLDGFDVAAVVEVIEHLDAPRLAAFERVLFEFAQPKTIVLSTPNVEYNVTWDLVNDDGTPKLRHNDHRFEWTRKEFKEWAEGMATKFNYKVRFLPIGEEDKKLGPPTQLAIFEK